MPDKVTKGYIKYKQPTRENRKGVFLWCVSYRQEGKVKRSEMYLHSGKILDFYVIAFKIWNKDINKEAFIDSYISYCLRKYYQDKEIKRIIIDKSKYPEIRLLSKQVDTYWFPENEEYLEYHFQELENILKETESTTSKILSTIDEYLFDKKTCQHLEKTDLFKAIETKIENFDYTFKQKLFLEYSLTDTFLRHLTDSQKIEFLKHIYLKVNKKHKISFAYFYELMGIDSSHSLWSKLTSK